MIEIPEGFIEKAPTHSDAELARIYGTSRSKIARIRARVGIKTPFPRGVRTTSRVLPTDFITRAKRHTNEELCRIYNASERTITRWRRETGLTAQRAISTSSMGRPYARTFTATAPAGVAPAAAMFLRTWFRPVYDRTVEGKEFKGQYVVGRQIMTCEEMIELASEKGFNQKGLYL